MKEIKEKKPRKFLKMLENVGITVAQEVLLRVIRGVVSRIGGKKQLPSILFLLASCGIAFAQYPATGNKQRLGFQTTADGLVWRGSLSDTASIQPTSNQNAWVILDTVNFKFYSFDFTSNVWNQLPSGTTIDTTSLSNRIDLRVRYADTATMLQNYALKYYVDSIANNFQDSINDITNGYFKQQFTSVTSDTLLWTRSVQLPTDENLLLAFRNGQILNNNQYTRIDTNKIKIAANSYKVGENYTIVYVKGGGGSGGGGSSFDTTDLNLQARLDLKLNISDTSGMLSNYATKAYADTSGRFYARQDFENVSSSTLTWTQTDTLVVGGVTVVQVYRNGQILLPSQYTIPTNASVVIGSTAYKAGENYTVIFPRGGGAGSGGGGSGSLTSISGGTGITVSPNPITTTGTVSADTTFLFTQSDTLSLNLTSRFAAKLNPADTISLSNRIDAKGSGTVTSVGSGFGLLGGTITTTGTLRLDTTTIYARLQDSIDVAIGGDTIKILKQEYQPATTSVLTWTVTSKFPIQLKAYILVFRNGQLLNNDQYNLTDTNKITIVSTSFKSGSNYTVATVSGIGSVGTGVYPNPVYPDAGIALSTGSAWASSITNNSANWNTAYTDRLKWDGGSTGLTAATGRTSLGGSTIGQSMFTLTNPSAITFPRFNADNTVSALSAANFRSAIGVGTVTSVTAASTSGNPLSITNTTTTPTIDIQVANTSNNGYLTSTDWNTFNGKQSALGFTPANRLININTTAPLQGGGDLTSDKTLSISQASGSANGFLSSTDWNTFNGKQNTLVSGTTIKTVNGNNLLGSGNLSIGTLVANDTVSLSNRINLKLNISDTTSMLTNYLRTGVAASTYQTKLNGTGFVKASGTSITYDNSTYLTTSSAASTYQTILTNPVTGTGVSGHIARFTGTSTLDSSSIYSSNGKIGVGIDVLTSSSHLTSKFVVRDNGNNFKFDGSTTSSGYTTTFSHDNTGLKIGHSSNIRDIRFTLNGTSGLTIANNSNSPARAVGIATDSPSHQLDVNGTFRATGAATLGSTLAVTGAITEGGLDVIKGSGSSGYIALFTSSDGIDNSPILNQSGIINFDSSVVVSNTLTVGGATYYSGYQIETGTGVNDFDVIAAGTSIYIFENTSAGSGTTTKEFLDSANSNTGRVITISNISDNAWDMAFTSIKPYTKTSTTINQLSSGQSITILSNGAKWLIISRNF